MTDPATELKHIQSALQAKEWLAADDAIIIPDADKDTAVEPHIKEFKWTTETYIAHVQIQDAFEDTDVTVCDIESEHDRPVVWLQWTADIPTPE